MTLKRGDTFCTLETIRQDVFVAWMKLLYLTSSKVTDINHEIFGYGILCLVLHCTVEVYTHWMSAECLRISSSVVTEP